MWKEFGLHFSSHSRKYWLFLLFVIVITSIILFEFFGSEELAHQKRVGEAILPFALGIGALLSGTAGLTYLESWLSKQKVQNKLVTDWIKRFPVRRLDKDFSVIQSEKSQGILYVWDEKKKTKHWIINPKTLRKLGLNYHDVQTLSELNFNKIPRGDNIDLDA